MRTDMTRKVIDFFTPRLIKLQGYCGIRIFRAGLNFTFFAIGLPTNSRKGVKMSSSGIAFKGEGHC